MNNQILFSYRRDEFLDSIEYLPPASGVARLYEVIEVRYSMSDKEATPIRRAIPEAQLGSWLDDEPVPRSVNDNTLPKASSRYLLGPTQGSREYQKSKIFPHLDCYGGYTLPFSYASFLSILEKFRLPAATPWMLRSSSTHFQMYTMGRTDQEQDLGITMRLSSRGILELDISTAISYQPSTGVVNAFLHGCTSEQQTEVRKKLQYLYVLAGHPLLLPIILAEMRMNAIKELEQTMWGVLLSVETRSGQTGAPAINSQEYQQNDDSTDWEKLAVDALSVMQIAPLAEDHANALLLSIEEIRKMLDKLDGATQLARGDYIRQSGYMLLEKLQFLSHGTQEAISKIQYIVKRAEAQQSAVYNYTAQRDARLQNFMANQSSQVAQASKRDSSAMKGIAVLTMVFLPGTFMATFFALPILDFTADSRFPHVKHTFWLYWAVTVPVTTAVLVGYIVFLMITGKKRRREDKDLDVQWDLEQWGKSRFLSKLDATVV